MDRTCCKAFPLRIEAASAKRLSKKRSNDRIGRRKRPRLISQIGKLDLSKTAPFVLRPRNNECAVVKQAFRSNVGLSLNRSTDAPNDEVDFALAQFANLLRDHRHLCDVYGNPRILSTEPLVHRRK